MCSWTNCTTRMCYTEVKSGPVGPEIYTDSKCSQLCCKLAVTITDSTTEYYKHPHCRSALPGKEMPGALYAQYYSFYLYFDLVLRIQQKITKAVGLYTVLPQNPDSCQLEIQVPNTHTIMYSQIH